MRGLDSVIFDLDGTLWDTCEACAAAWNNVRRRNGVQFRDVTTLDLRSVVGRPHAEAIRTIFQGISEPDLEILIHETMEEDNRAVAQTGGELYSGVREGLIALAGRYPLFIVSNCQSGYIEAFLQWSNLGGAFRDFECWGNTGDAKPENLKSIISRNKLSRPIFVGDTESDFAAAQSCAIPFVHVAYGFGSCQEADLKVRCFSDLVSHLANQDQ